MADTTKQANNKPNATAKVSVRLPRNKGQNAIQEEFFSVNFKNYTQAETLYFTIVRGETVEIPEELAEVIRNAELAEDYALKYAEENALRQP